MIRIGVLGARGRMGQWVTRLLNSEFPQQAQLGAAPTRGESLEPLLQSDAVVDFSSAESVIALAHLALAKPAEASLPAFVIATTGWRAGDSAVLDALAARTPVLISANFSTGVLAVLEILKQAGPLLKNLGYTPVLVETHHRHKKDAPSGTAIALRKAISPTAAEAIQTHSVRAGEIIGDHETTFYGPGDHITIGHFAQDRSIFARGAIQAALWLANHRSGPQALRGPIQVEQFFNSLRGNTKP